jgi:predicted RNA-binding Zn-ribbon protein involved in translation (DUF1610 family)
VASIPFLIVVGIVAGLIYFQRRGKRAIEADYRKNEAQPPLPAPATPLDPDQTVRCPYCGETILAIAQKCKHCGELLGQMRTAANPPSTRQEPGDIICPNPRCGYKGRPIKTGRGSCLVGGILLLFFIIPGVLYFMFKSGYRYSCPRCGMQIRTDN